MGISQEHKPVLIEAPGDSYKIECGASSIALHRNGTIVISGDSIIQRGNVISQSGTHNFRGSDTESFSNINALNHKRDKFKMNEPEPKDTLITAHGSQYRIVCGESSLTLGHDGRIVIMGERIILCARSIDSQSNYHQEN